MTARVTVYTRDGCHLCEEAIAVVSSVCAELGEDFVEIDIEETVGLPVHYDDEVPVTLVDGRQHDFWRVDPARLKAALTNPAPAGGAPVR